MHRSTSILFSLALSGILFLTAGCAGMQNTADNRYADDPNVVAVVGNEPITLSTFEREYAESVGSREVARTDSLAGYVDFLERYVNYRLKVRAAYERGYADNPDIQSELSSYRSEFGLPYLMDDRVLDPLVREMYDRSQYAVDASHILIRLPQQPSPQDTLAAFQQIQALEDSLERGADFADLARRHSQDPSASRQGRRGFEGRLGYFSAGQLVEPFETIAYETPEGEISEVFRTRFGYHIMKVHDRREVPADIRVSHILIRPEQNNEAAWDAARSRIDSLETAIAQGADFGQLATEYSEDPGSARKSGELGVISFASPLVQPFKDAAFDLEAEGDVSEPVRTRFGFHLIKLLERRPKPTLDESYNRLKKQVEQMPRYNQAREQYIQEAVKENEARIDTLAIQQAFADAPEDSLLQFLVEGRISNTSEYFAHFQDTSYTFEALEDYAPSARVRGRGMQQIYNLAQSFLADHVLDYEAGMLEERDPYFGQVMADFEDGLMLFALMEDEVWNAARQDSAALRRYFEEHREDYNLPERTRILAIQSASDSLLAAAESQLHPGADVSAVLEEVQIDSSSFVLDTLHLAEPSNSVYDQALALSEGGHTDVLTHENSYLVLINQGTEAARPMTFKEARPQVVNAYQEVLEDDLIEQLRETYDTKLYPSRLSQAYREPADAQAATSALIE